ALSPQLVYPNDKTRFPPNVTQLEVHWIPAQGTDLFELRFEAATLDLAVYLRCDESVGGGCAHQLSQDVYNYMSRSTGGAGPVSVTISGSNEAGAYGTSTTFTIEFAEQPVQ